jgi:hypothetical protein
LQRLTNGFPLLWNGAGVAPSGIPGAQRYTDFVAGIAVCNLGHAHPRIADAVARQANRLVHVSNLYYTIPQTELARMLVEHSFADRVFFGNSGAEANEAAIKLARKYFKDLGQPERTRIVSMENSFHGRTMATLSATGQEKIKKGYDPVLGGFSFVPFNDIDALDAAIDDRTCAVMLEPIQGEGGIRCPDPRFLQQDESALRPAGRTDDPGRNPDGHGPHRALFAHEHDGVTPDIMTLAKALANGLPIGAMLATERGGRFRIWCPRIHLRRNPAGDGRRPGNPEDNGPGEDRRTGPGHRGLFHRCPETAEAAAQQHCRGAGPGLAAGHPAGWTGRWSGGELHAKGLSGQLRAGGYPAFRTAADHQKKEIDLLIQCLDEVLVQ